MEKIDSLRLKGKEPYLTLGDGRLKEQLKKEKYRVAEEDEHAKRFQARMKYREKERKQQAMERIYGLHFIGIEPGLGNNSLSNSNPIQSPSEDNPLPNSAASISKIDQLIHISNRILNALEHPVQAESEDLENQNTTNDKYTSRQMTVFKSQV
jgi:hypothetical protein